MRIKVVSILAVVTLITLAQANAAEPRRVMPVNQPAVERAMDRGPDTTLLQSPNQVNGLFSDLSCSLCGTGVQILGENFVISTGGFGFNLDEVWIWGGYYSTDTPAGAPFEVYIAPDAAGIPGVPICSNVGITPTSDVTTGITLFGVSEHLIQLTLPVCNLADGTYWVYLYTDTGATPDDFFWETGDVDAVNGVAGSVWAAENPPVTWNSDAATDMAIQITGTVVPVELQSLSVE